MDYREFEVPLVLQRHVRCVWRLRDATPSPGPQVVYPDGCCELIVHLGPPMRRLEPDGQWRTQSAVMFAAQPRAPVRLAAQESVDCVGVRLQPAASSAIAGDALPLLRDQIVVLDTFDHELARALVTATTRFMNDQADAAIWELLAMRLLPCRPDSRIEAAAAELESTQGGRRVQDLATTAGMSLRSFQENFLKAVGLTAKEFARVQRLQAALRMLDAGEAALAQVAVDTGFADQSHATRELHQLTGLTPARLSKALREQREGEQTLRLAAVFVRGYA